MAAVPPAPVADAAVLESAEMVDTADLACDDRSLQALAAAIGDELRRRGEWLATAESCTGGLIAKLLTDVAGSSAWFERGIVSYSNAAKQELLSVPAGTIAEFGAVSAAVVLAMADGLKTRAPVAWTIAVSGVAGPGGGTADKPVGTVCIAWAGPGLATATSRFRYSGDRDAVRRQAARDALQSLLMLCREAEATGRNGD